MKKKSVRCFRESAVMRSYGKGTYGMSTARGEAILHNAPNWGVAKQRLCSLVKEASIRRTRFIEADWRAMRYQG